MQAVIIGGDEAALQGKVVAAERHMRPGTLALVAAHPAHKVQGSLRASHHALGLRNVQRGGRIERCKLQPRRYGWGLEPAKARVHQVGVCLKEGRAHAVAERRM